MEKVVKAANLYVATLKAITLIHQQSHWLSKGPNFYGNHLMFERAYNTAQESLDGAAEKMIGVFGMDGVDYSQQAKFLNQLLETYSKFSSNNIQMSINIEKDFLTLSKKIYDLFEVEDVMTLGLDDFIMSVSSNHEENVYLLQQAIS